MSKIVKTKLKIEGMHCSSCSMLIDMDLEDLEGVISSQIKYAAQEGEVEFDEDTVKLEDILRQIEKTGYKAQVIS